MKIVQRCSLWVGKLETGAISCRHRHWGTWLYLCEDGCMYSLWPQSWVPLWSTQNVQLYQWNCFMLAHISNKCFTKKRKKKRKKIPLFWEMHSKTFYLLKFKTQAWTSLKFITCHYLQLKKYCNRHVKKWDPTRKTGVIPLLPLITCVLGQVS